jgi:hypothetical protein
MAKGRKTGGRQAGTPNKSTAEAQAAAQEHSPAALGTLVGIMQDGEAPAAARVSAAREILDRAHGKPPQALQVGDPDGQPLGPVTFIVKRDTE